jgi:hypothetical protein
MSNTQKSSVELLIAEIKRRVAIIQSEPQTMARELMIDNLSVDLEQYEAMHKEEMIDFAQTWAASCVTKEHLEYFYNERFKNEHQ